MGILKGLFKSRDKPKNRTAGSAYSFFMGNSTAGKRVNERSSMQLTTVYACVRILAEAVAGLPLNLYEYKENGSKEKAFNNPLYFLLHDEPNPEMTSFIFRETLMTHLLLWGNAYAQIVRNGRGEILGLYPLMPDRMTVDRDDKGQLYYEYRVNSDDAPINENSTVKLKPYEVFHIAGLGFDGLVGYSPIAMAKNAIGMAIACEEFGSKFFANGAQPSGVLEHPGLIKDIKRVRASWQAAYGGSTNANKTAVLEEGMKYTPISIAPEQAQFLETRKFQIDEIARIFRIPPHMVGDLEKSSFSNIEQQSLEFVKYTLDPWVSRWEQAITRSLLTAEEKKKYFVKFNVDGLLRGDYESRMRGYSIGIQNGFMSPNDVRELENMNLIPDELGGNRYMCNGNMVDIGSAGNWSEKYKKEEIKNLFVMPRTKCEINGAGKIIAVDFDNTLAVTKYPKIIKPVFTTIELVKRLKSEGATIILWTCREGGILCEAVEWCEKQKIPIDYINENTPESIKLYGDSRKINANIYIDDKNYYFRGEDM